MKRPHEYIPIVEIAVVDADTLRVIQSPEDIQPEHSAHREVIVEACPN